MSYQEDAVKEYILSTIKNNTIPLDCLEIVYNKIKENILLTYNTFTNVILLNASYFELTILYANGLIINTYEMYNCITHNYLTGVIFIINNIDIPDDYIYKYIMAWLCKCCNVNNLEILKQIYNKYYNYIPSSWVSVCIFDIVRYKHINILNWLREQEFTIYLNNIDHIIYMNNYQLIENACDLNIEISCYPISVLQESIKNKRIDMMNVIYDKLIKNKLDNELNDIIDTIIVDVVNNGNKIIYEWIKTKNIIFSLEQYDNDENNIIKKLEENFNKCNFMMYDYDDYDYDDNCNNDYDYDY